jgi:iron complex outermembrane receptor protein
MIYFTFQFRILFVLIFVLVASNSYGQQRYSVSGQIVDSLQNPIDGAIVNLLKSLDSTLVKTGLTEADGRFSVLLSQEGNYFLLATMLGYEKFTSEKFELGDGLAEKKFLSISLNTVAG